MEEDITKIRELLEDEGNIEAALPVMVKFITSAAKSGIEAGTAALHHCILAGGTANLEKVCQATLKGVPDGLDIVHLEFKFAVESIIENLDEALLALEKRMGLDGLEYSLNNSPREDRVPESSKDKSHKINWAKSSKTVH
jgi:hypothetical protein